MKIFLNTMLMLLGIHIVNETIDQKTKRYIKEFNNKLPENRKRGI